MSVAAAALLVLAAVLGALAVRRVEVGRAPRRRPLVGVRGDRRRGSAVALVLVVLVGAAAALAWVGDPATPWLRSAVALAAVAAAALGGGPVVTAVLTAADPERAVASLRGDAAGVADPEVLRGGAWIGVLERLALAATLLLGWPEGVPVVLAVKGLGRFAELAETPAAERFIIGTLTSVLWAGACAGVAVLAAR
ncbi:hypothetical protein SAMN05660199_03679 [Klenkia soli]|uniref:Uncharacterized protein n=1 Tax=Klenkia soli TaxID=1052260 RepID=A0A1H0RYH1_9ACTN|nr:hypothetical protein [Klenkia soli]SDP34530.1 hypothetical protein SAMN05660199_03679 [Klenkia soli]